MEIGLYIHIPFCISKCYYCDFLSFSNETLYNAYTEALIKEIKNYAKIIDKSYSIQSIFIGGGTPTMLPPLLLDKICKAVIDCFALSDRLEWTIEANPGTITESLIYLINTYPISRISLGLQSTHNRLLQLIGRRHSFEDWQRSMTLLKEKTMCDLSSDVMFALPTQTMAEFKETLQVLADYPLSHLSLYGLIVEEGTRLFDFYSEGRFIYTDEDTDRAMYHYAKVFLKDIGYNQYEISNWAKAGKACRHNMLYWQRKPYIGVGLGAHSFFENTRYHNEENINAYIQKAGQLELLQLDKEKITLQMAMQEFMFLGLRMTDGISIKAFKEVFQRDLFDVYKSQLDKWIKHHILVKDNDSLRLSDYGMDICNEVFSSFL